jgi:hypothetical protein
MVAQTTVDTAMVKADAAQKVAKAQVKAANKPKGNGSA